MCEINNHWWIITLNYPDWNLKSSLIYDKNKFQKSKAQCRSRINVLKTNKNWNDCMLFWVSFFVIYLKNQEASNSLLNVSLLVNKRREHFSHLFHSNLKVSLTWFYCQPQGFQARCGFLWNQLKDKNINSNDYFITLIFIFKVILYYSIKNQQMMEFTTPD